MQFFPEGGNLVQGLESVVGFKVADQYDTGMDAEGFVINATNDTIQHFRTGRFGMGHFLFTPQRGATYTAVVQLANGMKISKSLPQVYDDGYVMHLSESENAVNISVQATTNNAPVTLFVHTRGVRKAIQQQTFQQGKALFQIDKKSLGDGISQFTVFTASLQPVCERLYFKQPDRDSTFTISINQEAVAPRQKVELTLTPTFSNTHTASDLSVSVFKLDSLQGTAGPDISTYLWLTSDLRGTIEQPDYYLQNNDPEALENLLLTQGWRRFQWETILKNVPVQSTFSLAYEGPVIEAVVTERNTGKPVPNVAAYLSAPGESGWLSTATSNDSGLLRFAVNRLYHHDTLVLQTANAADGRIQVELQPQFSEQFSTRVPARFQLSEANKAALLEQHVSVQAALFTRDRPSFYHTVLPADTTAFYGMADAQYSLDEYTRFTTMEEVMREYVPEVRLRRQGDRFSFFGAEHTV